MLRKYLSVCGLQSKSTGSYTTFTFNSASRNFQLLYLVRKFQQYGQLALVTTNLALSWEKENSVKAVGVFLLPSSSFVQHWIKLKSLKSAMVT